MDGTVSCKPYSIYQSQSILPKKIWNKNKKGEIVPKNFDFFYSAVNARLKRRKNKHLFDLILNSLRIELSHSDNIILDN